MTYPGLSMWNGSSKIHNFMDFWHSFCWRLWRPRMLLSTKSKGHKSNDRISLMYWYHIHDLEVHFWCLISVFVFMHIEFEHSVQLCNSFSHQKYDSSYVALEQSIWIKLFSGALTSNFCSQTLWLTPYPSALDFWNL